MLFNDLKYGKNSLLCCNKYSQAIFTILFNKYQVKELRKSSTKEKKNFKVLMTFLLLFYYFMFLKYINSTKNRFSNKKIGHCAKSNFDFKFKDEHLHQISSLYL